MAIHTNKKKASAGHSDTNEVVRAELNLEKLANIWQPKKAKNKLNEVVVERPNGAKIQCIANSKFGALTTETQRVLYALYLISEEQNHPRRLSFSCHKLAHILRKEWGSSVKILIETALYQLRGTLFVFKDAFFVSSENKVVRIVDTFTILTELKMTKVEFDGHTTKEACYCEFNQYIHSNLVNNHVKPVFLDTVLSLGDDGIAQIIYTHLDLILSETPVYKRRSEGFLKELNLSGQEYTRVNYRKKTLERVVAKLNGKELSKGGYLSLEIVKTVDQKDYNLVAHRSRIPLGNNQPTQQEEQKNKSSGNNSVTRQKNAKSMAHSISNIQEAVKLIQHFHKKFFGVEGVDPGATELAYAAQLMQKYGYCLAEYIIDFAFEKAPETQFKIGVFKGCLIYEGSAVASYKKGIEASQVEKLDPDPLFSIQNCPYCLGRGILQVTRIIDGDGNEKLCDDGPPCAHNIDEIIFDAQRYNLKVVLPDGRSFDYRGTELELG